MKKITFITDTHTKHKQLGGFLPGGDILIHAGDVMNSGRHESEAIHFLEWFNSLDNYKYKIFIAGNHDRLFEDVPTIARELFGPYHPNIIYLQDSFVEVEGLKIYGSPWQPEFCDWAFNLPRGEKLKAVWDLIPIDTDILITHGPPHGKLDYIKYENRNVGCEELLKRVQEIKPKIHVFGHVHESYGYVFDGNTHYINAAVLNGRYIFQNKPLIVEWDEKTNELEFK